MSRSDVFQRCEALLQPARPPSTPPASGAEAQSRGRDDDGVGEGPLLPVAGMSLGEPEVQWRLEQDWR